jgi:hypothetical protein
MRWIDRHHVNERLAVVAEAVERESTQRHSLLERWSKALDRSDAAIRRIANSSTSGSTVRFPPVTTTMTRYRGDDRG